MIKVENIEVSGWKAAIKSMRNPLQSWDKSDSFRSVDCTDECREIFTLGKNDLELMQKLVKAGSDHAKFMRFINVTMDITAPTYFFLQFDTFKVGTVSNSTSKMHTIHKTPITEDLFSFDKTELSDVSKAYLEELEILRQKFVDTGDKKFWYSLIQRLPESFNQLRTVQFNYQVAQHMYHSRKNHKLDEWRELCNIMLNELPYFAVIIGIQND